MIFITDESLHTMDHRWGANCRCGWGSLDILPNGSASGSDAHTMWEKHIREKSGGEW
jgi:hypothetical protein